jgi:hypothetical protein
MVVPLGKEVRDEAVPVSVPTMRPAADTALRSA